MLLKNCLSSESQSKSTYKQCSGHTGTKAVKFDEIIPVKSVISDPPPPIYNIIVDGPTETKSIRHKINDFFKNSTKVGNIFVPLEYNNDVFKDLKSQQKGYKYLTISTELEITDSNKETSKKRVLLKFWYEKN